MQYSAIKHPPGGAKLYHDMFHDSFGCFHNQNLQFWLWIWHSWASSSSTAEIRQWENTWHQNENNIKKRRNYLKQQLSGSAKPRKRHIFSNAVCSVWVCLHKYCTSELMGVMMCRYVFNVYILYIIMYTFFFFFF